MFVTIGQQIQQTADAGLIRKHQLTVKQAICNLVALLNVRLLSKTDDVNTRRIMSKPFATPLDRLIVVLCAVLLIFFAATVPTKTMDQFQHAPMVLAEHDHTGTNNFSVNAVYDDQEDHGEETPSSDDHLSDGHHHHGDSGSSLIVSVGTLNFVVRLSSSLHGMQHERQIPGLRSVGPERPPRTSLLNT